MEHEAEFDWLLEQLPPYQALLRYGQVDDLVEDADAWRQAIRAEARRDKIRVRTFAVGTTSSGLVHVIALRVRSLGTAEVGRAMRRGSVAEEAADRASLYGHEVRWLRGHETRQAGRCVRCGGRAYIDSAPAPPVIEGDVYERSCLGAAPD